MRALRALRALRARLNAFAGHIWHAGRMLCIPALIHREDFFRQKKVRLSWNTLKELTLTFCQSCYNKTLQIRTIPLQTIFLMIFHFLIVSTISTTLWMKAKGIHQVVLHFQHFPLKEIIKIYSWFLYSVKLSTHISKNKIRKKVSAIFQLKIHYFKS